MRSQERPFAFGLTGIGLTMALVGGPSTEANATSFPTPNEPDAVLIGAGDIGHCKSTGDDKMAAVVDKMLQKDKKAVVFTAGDNAYPNGTTRDFRECFGPSWGRFKARIKLPSPGNHEYHEPNITAKPYFDYFGKAAQSAEANEPFKGKGYYARNYGNWRVYILNSETGEDAQKERLKADIKKHPSKFKMAIAHRPLFSSGTVHGRGDKNMKPFWDILSKDKKSKLMINGHDHHAEVFAHQTSEGKKNKNGLRQVIIGIGGGSLYDTGKTLPNSEFIYNKTPGVLKLSLHKNGNYNGEIISVNEKVVYKFKN